MTTDPKPTGRPILWPLKPCTRCDGTGSYSWNSADGTKCYGCGGGGNAFANKAAATIAAAWRAEREAAKRQQIGNLEPGTVVAIDDHNRPTEYGRTGWATVAAVTIDDTALGCHAATITTATGDTLAPSAAGLIVRTRNYVSPLPAMLAAADTLTGEARTAHLLLIAEAGWDAKR